MTLRDKLKFWILLSSYVEMIVRGTSPLSLPNAIADSLEYLKAFGGTEQNGTPTPTTPIDIVSNNGVLKVSRNLFDASTITLNYYYKDDGVWTKNVATYTSAPIYIGAGTTVTFSRSLAASATYLRIHAFNSNNEWIGLVAKSEATTSLSTAGTTPANTAYIRVCGAKNAITDITDSDIQVEQGSTATPYMPYGEIYTDGTVETIEDTIGNTATAEMLLKIGDYQDVQSIIDGTVTRNVGVKVLDGTENWVFLIRPTGNPIAYSDTVITNRLIEATGVSTHFINNQNLDIYGGSFYGVSTQRVNFSLLGIGNEDLTSWKNWLADQYANGTPVIIVYPLATPTTESVAGQTMQVQQGDNIVEITQASLNNLELEAKYKKQA